MKSSNLFSLPVDEYNHLAIEDAKTDPYGSLEFAVGSGDDFVCFDYSIFDYDGGRYCALHSVLNSETGHFIEDFRYEVYDRDMMLEGEILVYAYYHVMAAIDWRLVNGVDHDKRGWNQDQFYFVRALARAYFKHGVECEGLQALARNDRWFRFGSKRVNREIESFSHHLRGQLPVSRQPYYKKMILQSIY